MATADKKSLFVNGGNGQIVSTGNPVTDLERAQDVARRYRCEFVDLADFQLHHDLFKKISPDLMFRYKFVPLGVVLAVFVLWRWKETDRGADRIDRAILS